MTPSTHLACGRPRNSKRATYAMLRIPIVAAALIAGVASTARALPPANVPDDFYDQTVVAGLDRPVGMAFLPDGRLIVIESHTARVRLIVDGKLGAVDPIGTIDSVAVVGEEQGLMGVAADPGWPDRPYLYFNYAGIDGSLHITRYTVLGEVDESTSGVLFIDAASKYRVLQGIPDLVATHDGGTLRFGPDGMLFASFGDDTQPCAATDSTLLHGVVVRLDVSGLPDGAGGPPSRALLIPGDNPFASHPNPDVGLVWAFGFRNPFRFHIDPETGAVFVADVGQSDYEEVSYLPGPGMHAGWPYFEGTATFTTGCGPPMPPGLTAPIYAYSHGSLSAGAASVISAGPYRTVACLACTFPEEYDGDYFFSDFYEGFLRRMKYSNGTWAPAPPVPGQVNATNWATGLRFVSDYLEGADGALWYCRWADGYNAPVTGEIRRIYYQSPLLDAGSRPATGVTFDAPYPSPVRNSARFAFTLPEGMDVALDLFDPAGRRVRSVGRERMEAGPHAITWDGRAESGQFVSPGVYIARLSTGRGVTLTRRFTVVR